MSLSIRVVNGVSGLSAAGLGVRIERAVNGGWAEIARYQTDKEGQVGQWPQEPLWPGAYRLEFGTDPYFASLGFTPIYTLVSLEFRMPDPGYPHRVRLMLTPVSYLVCWQR
jgi:5-hydroxyisourate hydrolase